MTKKNKDIGMTFVIDGKKQTLFLDGKRYYGKVKLRGVKLTSNSETIHIDSNEFEYKLTDIGYQHEDVIVRINGEEITLLPLKYSGDHLKT